MNRLYGSEGSSRPGDVPVRPGGHSLTALRFASFIAKAQSLVFWPS